MYLIVGLGNPGEKFKNTRHNVGYIILDKLVRDKSLSFSKKNKFKAEVCHLSEDVLLAKPLTFMNNSGLAVNSLITYYSRPPCFARRSGQAITQLLIVHDDVDLELGRLKIQKGGGTAGHHGLESIAKSLGTADFIRFRIGIGKPQEKLEVTRLDSARQGSEKLEAQIGTTDFVLQNFSSKEWLVIEKTIDKTVEAIEYYLEHGLEKAMNKYNKSN